MKSLKITLVCGASLLMIVGEGYLYASNGIKLNLGYDIPKAPSQLEKTVNDSTPMPSVPVRLPKEALEEWQSMQLQVYDVGDNRQEFDNAIADSVAKLKEKSWKTLSTVSEEDVNITVMQYGDGALIAGLSIMASTPDKAVFLNLVGPL